MMMETIPVSNDENKEQKTVWLNGKTPWQCLLDDHRGYKDQMFYFMNVHFGGEVLIIMIFDFFASISSCQQLDQKGKGCHSGTYIF